MKEKLFKAQIATWTDGSSTWVHIKATDLKDAKRIAWEKWKSTLVLATKTSWRDKIHVGIS
jgi:hypothetical protein